MSSNSHQLEEGWVRINRRAITRFEVIDRHGRRYVRMPCYIDLSVQDEGRTLKVFVNDAITTGEEVAPKVLVH